MSENKASEAGDLMSELQKLQSEISETSSSSSTQLVNKSTFEEFQNEQQKFNSEIIETLRMMRDEMTRGIAEISVEKEGKQKNINEETLENLEIIEDEKMKLLAEQMFDEKVLKKLEIIRKGFKEMDEKQDKISKDMQETLKNMRNDVTHLEEKKHEKSLIRVHVNNLAGKFNDFVLVPGDTIFSLKLKIQDKDGIAADRIRLICEGKQLEDERALEYYNIDEHSTIHQVMRMVGNGPCYCCFKNSENKDENTDKWIKKFEKCYENAVDQTDEWMSRLEKLQLENVENSSSSSAKLMNKSTFEEFQNEQQKFNLEMVETLRMMRQEMTCGMDKIAAEIEAEQEKVKENEMTNIRFQRACSHSLHRRNKENVEVEMKILRDKMSEI